AAELHSSADKLFDGKTTHDFGKVPRGPELKHTFQITNIYKYPIDITGYNSSCGCTAVKIAKQHILSGETADVEVVMDSRLFFGAHEVTIRVFFGPDDVASATLKISATVADAPGEAAKSDQELLQGLWHVINGGHGGRKFDDKDVARIKNLNVERTRLS